MNFSTLKNAVALKFDRMERAGPLFRTAVSKDQLWDTYLASFPEGSNPIFRERHEHDCSCCKQFIRAMGDTVAIIDGKIQTIWDFAIPAEPNYQVVADAMNALVSGAPILEPFLHYERKVGTDKTFEQLIDQVRTWEHFFVNLPARYVVAGKDIATKLGEQRSTHDVLLRSLREITPESVSTVLELIAQRSLYRGEEHQATLQAFKALQATFLPLPPAEQDVLAWKLALDASGPVSRIRNTSIGTLLVNLSEGRDIESAVGAFEAMVAPANYKRPTALITQGMIDKAKVELEDLGLTSALERRYARTADITVNNLLFVDRETRPNLAGDVFGGVAPTAPTTPKSFDKVDEVTIDRFIAEILPRAESIEVLMQNQHVPNLVSLIAPVDPTAGRLFKWANNFSWSYNGEMADSVKERVKKAGGNVTGDLCCRLAWSNFDDLDFHMVEPDKFGIFYANKGPSRSGGRLDVDMNAGGGITREPVENIFYGNRHSMREGIYTLKVNNFSRRESIDIGFEVEIDYLGTVQRFTYDRAMRTGEFVEVATITYTHAGGAVISSALPSTSAGRLVWGITTEAFHKVNVMMLSPNYWDERAVGNKHYFFMINGCKNDGTARGFFNEFLKDDLTAHRKVFEVVGSKMKVPESADQLSGLGFSSTQKGTLVCRVKGSFTRVIKIVF